MPDGGIITAEDLAGLKADLEKVSGDVKGFATDIMAKVAAGQEVTAELKQQVDKALIEANAEREKISSDFGKLLEQQNARLLDLEQKGARHGGHEQTVAQTPGEKFLADEKVKAILNDPARSRWRGRLRADMAAITTVTAGATRDVLVPYDRIPGVVTIPNRRMTVRDLLTPGRTSQNAIQYVREVGFSNAAATVSEGALKPESDIDYALETANVVTIAHWIRASKQILDDAPMLQSSIDGRLRYGLAFAEEVSLLNGAGGSDLDGLIPNATNFTRIFTPETPTRIDDIRLAILQTELAYFPATGVVLHPTDWARIETTKDADGRYLISSSDGQGNATSRLWGLPVVPTQAMTVTKFLVGAFMLGAQLFDREDATVEISTEDQDNFVRNLISIRAEERLALAIYRPEAFVFGTFQAST